ncbi:hypothetical protein GP486_006483, partial [Trichoglossum hirsutum]
MQWCWSPTAGDPSQQPGFREESRLGDMLSVESHAGVDDYLLHELSDTNEVTYDFYEQNCPYQRIGFSNSLQPNSKMFRLVEEFSDGLVYKGDSFGDHSYIDADQSRECSSLCRCRLHDQTPEAFTFTAYKSPTRLAVTVNSIHLYSELINAIGLECIQLEAPGQGAVVNGLVLLKHYQTLSAHLNTLSLSLAGNPTTHSLILEMTLLIHGFLLDGEIFRSYGYEDLYEDAFLTFEHWKEFQQARLERDISSLEEGYYAIDETSHFEESSMPPAQADPPDRAREVHPIDIHMDENPTALSEPIPGLVSDSDAQSSPSTLTLPEIEMQFIAPLAESITQDHQGDQQSLYRFAERENANFSVWSLAEKREPDREPVLRPGQGFLAAPDSDGNWYDGRITAAAKIGDELMVRFLLYNGVVVDSSKPLAEAAKAGHEPVVRLLLDHGAVINGVRDRYGYSQSPLAEAAKAGHKSVVRSLLDRGADIDDRGYRKSKSPLNEAVKAGHESIVRLLLDRGANVNGVATDSSETPLAKAVKAGDESIFRLLLDRGAASVIKIIAEYSDSESTIRSFRRSVVQRALTARQPTLGDRRLPHESNYDPQHYIECKQRLQTLYKEFGEQCLKLTEEAENALTSFRDLAKGFRGHREAWARGIKTLRNLCNGRLPRNLDDAIAFLCISKAISKTLDANGACDYTNQFLSDLDRWQVLFSPDATALGAYREAVRMMWGIVLDKDVLCSVQASKLETLTYFQALASTLVRQTSRLLNIRSTSDKGLESSQRRWRLRRNQNPPDLETSYGLPDSSLSGQCLPPSGATNSKPPDPVTPPKGTSLRRDINRDNSSAKMNPIVVLLMAGAIFAIVLLFLKRQRNASVEVNCKDWKSQQFDVKHATNHIVNRLQQITPASASAVVKLQAKLSYILEFGIITRFSELRQAFVDITCSS